MIRTIHRAKYLLADADHLMQHAAVHVSDPGRISRVEPCNSLPTGVEAKMVDWGSALILPGLVNAHTHLELTDMGGQLTRFNSFTDWVRQLMQKRQGWREEDFRKSSVEGARRAIEGGTTLVGDISASGASREGLKTERLRKVVFEEALSISPEKAPERLVELEGRLSRVEDDRLLTSGVSPHAPYSVSPDLYRGVSALASARDLPLATHIAETREELEFLERGTGEFRELLADLGVLPDNWQPPGKTPVSYLDQLGLLNRPALLVHCNYLDDASVATILKSRSSVVYCPRSHSFFGHEDHPVRRLLDRGVNVALGTDSLASNDSLSMLDEMRFLFKRRTDLHPTEIIRLATLNGAAALGFGGCLGRLRRGYWADMCVLEVPEGLAAKNLLNQVLEGAGECVATIVEGEIAWKKR